MQALTRANPWWTKRGWEQADPQLSLAARAPFEYAPGVLRDVAPPNLYTLRGPRRAGKSTVLKQTVVRLIDQGVDPRRICHFSADALTTFTDLINLFEAARLLFPDLADTPRYFLLDEVTAIPEWQRGIKWVRDNTASAGDCIVATGSSARDVAAGATHLAGRRGPDVGLDRLLPPMSFHEFVRCAGFDVPPTPRLPLTAFYERDGRAACQTALVHAGVLVDAFEAYLLSGGFPQAVADFRLRAQVSDGFIRDLWDVTQSDLRAMGMSRPEQGLRLLERIAVSLTAPVVIRSIAQELDVSHTTAGEWLSALADAYLVLLLFQESGGVPDVRRQRKVYPADPLLARLPSRLSAGAFDPDASRLAEAAIAGAVFRAVEPDAAERFGAPRRLYYYRSQNGAEVDLIVPPVARGGAPRALETKYVDAVTAKGSRAMVASFGGGLLVTRGAVDLDQRVQGVTVIPAGIFAWLLDQGD